VPAVLYGLGTRLPASR